MEKPS